MITYLKGLKKLFWINASILVISVIAGLLFPAMLGFEQALIDRLRERALDLPWYGLIGFILFNNVRSSIMIILSGFFFISIPLLAMNGYFIGTAISLSGKPLGIALLSLVPHGIFEIPALLLSVALGTLISARWLHKPHNFKKMLGQTVRFYGKIILPLLIIAAIIESVLILFLR